MSQPNVEFLDSDLLKEADQTSRLPSLAPAADELRTVRLAPIAHPLSPEGAARMTPAILPPPTPLPSFSDVPPPPKPSWLGALLASAFHPAGGSPSARDRERGVRVMLGWGALVLGVVFAMVALFSGARAALPPDASLAPSIGVAAIAARTVFALGSGALGYLLFRMTERLLTRGGSPGHTE